MDKEKTKQILDKVFYVGYRTSVKHGYSSYDKTIVDSISKCHEIIREYCDPFINRFVDTNILTNIVICNTNTYQKIFIGKQYDDKFTCFVIDNESLNDDIIICTNELVLRFGKVYKELLVKLIINPSLKFN